MSTPASNANARRLGRLQRLSRLLDRAVRLPGSERIGIGLDSLLGLIPGLGDLLGLVMSGYIVIEGLRMGAPVPVLLRMLGNIAVDALVGIVPVLGDIFDIAWQANVRNVALLERHVDAPPRGRRQSAATATLVVAALLALVILVLVAAVALIGWLLGIGA